MRAEPVAQDIGTDVILGEGQRHPPVAGADQIRFLEIDGKRVDDRLRHVRRPGPDHAVHGEHARKRAAELVAELAGRRAVLDLDDRLVVDIEQELIGQPRGAGDLLGLRMVARAGDVAEEVRLARGAGRIERWRILAQMLEHLAERLLHATLHRGETLPFHLAVAGRFEVIELLDELLQALWGPGLRVQAKKRTVVRITKHEWSQIVELEDGSEWRIWPGDLAMTLKRRW